MDLNDEMKTMMMNIENHTNHINQKIRGEQSQSILVQTI